MKNIFKNNCCDGIYNSFDIHFTSACDNKCEHCIDLKYSGLNINKPDIRAISNTIISNQNGFDDVLFLGGEPCLYLEELLECIRLIRKNSQLKIYVTTSVPKNCFDKKELFYMILEEVDGINLSVQHYKEDIADEIRKTKSKFDRQTFYQNLPNKNKIRINLNIVKPFLFTKEELMNCLLHYDKMGFNEIKISEIQHGTEFFVSFEEVFNLRLQPAFSTGCQTYLNNEQIFSLIKTPILLKRSCFMCEETLKASWLDVLKVGFMLMNRKKDMGKYGVVYENGLLTKQWR